MLSPQQIVERKGGLGGSDAAAALGLSPWKTPYKLWREKTGADQKEDISNKPAIEWGNILEDVVCNKWAKDAGFKVQRINTMLKSAQFPFMIGYIDRAVINPAIAGRVVWNGKRLTTDQILEVKTSLSGYPSDEWGEEGTDQIPQHYLLQAMHYIVVAGVDICQLGLLQAGPSFKRYQVKRHPQVIEMMVEGERDFWNMVTEGIPPPPETAQDVKLRFPVDVGAQVEATPFIAQQFYRYSMTKERAKFVDNEIDDAALHIQKFMGDAAELTIQGVPVLTWKADKPSQRLNVDQLKKDAPEIYAQFLVDKSSVRRMLIKQRD